LDASPVDARVLMLAWMYEKSITNLRSTCRRNLQVAWAALALVLPVVLFSPETVADSDTDRLKQIKAAFVLNIAKFVTWPEKVYQQRPQQLMVCHYQYNALGEAFGIIDGKVVEGRRLSKKTVGNLPESVNCDILLVPTEALAELENEAQVGFDKPVLTIADMTDRRGVGQAHNGVLVALVRKNSSIGFEVNLQQAQKNGLKVSSELLKLATIVGGESE